MLFERVKDEIRDYDLVRYYTLVFSKYYGMERAKEVIAGCVAGSESMEDVVENIKLMYKSFEHLLKVKYVFLTDFEKEGVVWSRFELLVDKLI